MPKKHACPRTCSSANGLSPKHGAIDNSVSSRIAAIRAMPAAMAASTWRGAMLNVPGLAILVVAAVLAMARQTARCRGPSFCLSLVANPRPPSEYHGRGQGHCQGSPSVAHTRSRVRFTHGASLPSRHRRNPSPSPCWRNKPTKCLAITEPATAPKHTLSGRPRPSLNTTAATRAQPHIVERTRRQSGPPVAVTLPVGVAVLCYLQLSCSQAPPTTHCCRS